METGFGIEPNSVAFAVSLPINNPELRSALLSPTGRRNPCTLRRQRGRHMGSNLPSRRHRWLRAILVVAAAGLLVLVAAWLLYQYAPRRTPAGQPELMHLAAGNPDAFTAAFNDASPTVRVVLMLSPT